MFGAAMCGFDSNLEKEKKRCAWNVISLFVLYERKWP